MLCAAAPAVGRRLWGPVAVGLATGAVLSCALATRPVTAEIRGHTVGYGMDVPYAPLLVTGYLFATLGALLLAGDRRIAAARGRDGRRGGGLRGPVEA